MTQISIFQASMASGFCGGIIRFPTSIPFNLFIMTIMYVRGRRIGLQCYRNVALAEIICLTATAYAPTQLINLWFVWEPFLSIFSCLCMTGIFWEFVKFTQKPQFDSFKQYTVGNMDADMINRAMPMPLFGRFPIAFPTLVFLIALCGGSGIGNHHLQHHLFFEAVLRLYPLPFIFTYVLVGILHVPIGIWLVETVLIRKFVGNIGQVLKEFVENVRQGTFIESIQQGTFVENVRQVLKEFVENVRQGTFVESIQQGKFVENVGNALQGKFGDTTRNVIDMDREHTKFNFLLRAVAVCYIGGYAGIEYGLVFNRPLQYLGANPKVYPVLDYHEFAELGIYNTWEEPDIHVWYGPNWLPFDKEEAVNEHRERSFMEEDDYIYDDKMRNHLVRWWYHSYVQWQTWNVNLVQWMIETPSHLWDTQKQSLGLIKYFRTYFPEPLQIEPLKAYEWDQYYWDILDPGNPVHERLIPRQKKIYDHFQERFQERLTVKYHPLVFDKVRAFYTGPLLSIIGETMADEYSKLQRVFIAQAYQQLLVARTLRTLKAGADTITYESLSPKQRAKLDRLAHRYGTKAWKVFLLMAEYHLDVERLKEPVDSDDDEEEEEDAFDLEHEVGDDLAAEDEVAFEIDHPDFDDIIKADFLENPTGSMINSIIHESLTDFNRSSAELAILAQNAAGLKTQVGIPVLDIRAPRMRDLKPEGGRKQTKEEKDLKPKGGRKQTKKKKEETEETEEKRETESAEAKAERWLPKNELMMFTKVLMTIPEYRTPSKVSALETMDNTYFTLNQQPLAPISFKTKEEMKKWLDEQENIDKTGVMEERFEMESANPSTWTYPKLENLENLENEDTKLENEGWLPQPIVSLCGHLIDIYSTAVKMTPKILFSTASTRPPNPAKEAARAKRLALRVAAEQAQNVRLEAKRAEAERRQRITEAEDANRDDMNDLDDVTTVSKSKRKVTGGQKQRLRNPFK
jgi:hypothetical protein